MNGIGLSPRRSLRFLSWGGGAILGQNLSWNFNELHVMHAFYPFRPRPPPRLRRVGPLRVGRGLNPWRSLRFLSCVGSSGLCGIELPKFVGNQEDYLKPAKAGLVNQSPLLELPGETEGRHLCSEGLRKFPK